MAQVCHVGDALAEEAAVSGGFAGIVVDLFAEGQILPALQQVISVALSALTSSLCTAVLLSIMVWTHFWYFGSSTRQYNACKAATLMCLCF